MPSRPIHTCRSRGLARSTDERRPISGLPEIGTSTAQVGYSRLAFSGLPEIGTSTAQVGYSRLAISGLPEITGNTLPAHGSVPHAEDEAKAASPRPGKTRGNRCG